MTVTPDAVEAAARAMRESDLASGIMTGTARWYERYATAALAAAAPLIAQQTLLDLAQEMHDWAALHAGPDGAHFARLWATRITARAATLTPKEN